jgi:hypothetical protein
MLAIIGLTFLSKQILEFNKYHAWKALRLEGREAIKLNAQSIPASKLSSLQAFKPSGFQAILAK